MYFSLIVSWGENGFNSSGAIPAIDIALEKINSMYPIPGYYLTYETVRNSKVNSQPPNFVHVQHIFYDCSALEQNH